MLAEASAIFASNFVFLARKYQGNFSALLRLLISYVFPLISYSFRLSNNILRQHI